MDDDFFDDDDGLDDLPANTLQELETRAFQATQHHTITAANQKQSSSDYGLGDGDGEEEVIDLDAPPQANVVTARQPSQPPSTRFAHQPRASQYSRPPDEVTQREQWRQQRYGVAAQHRLPAFRPPRPSSANGYAPQPGASQGPISQAQTPPANGEQLVGVQPTSDSGPASDVAVLQARIAELERNQSALLHDNQDAKAQAYTKAGEIAIIRANQDKTVSEYERKLAALQELHAQDLSKHKAEIEVVRKERERIETNNKFLQHDLVQETDRARKNRLAPRGGNENSKAHRSPASTPKKPASLPFRDGFNDDEVVRISPTKSKDSPQAGTPKAVSKRKRPEHESSPAKQLPFSDKEASPAVDVGSPSTVLRFNLPERLRPLPETDSQFDFVQLVLNHRQSDGRRSIELLTNYALPSRPDLSLSSELYDALHAAKSHAPEIQIEVYFSDKLLHLWSRCLQERFFGPLLLIISLLQDVLLQSSDQTSAMITSSAVPLIVRTVEMIAIPKARAWANPTMKQGPPPELEAVVSSSNCLDLLQVLAWNCSEHNDALNSLWSCMEQEFVLVVLHKAQSLSDRISMLHILATSILTNSFGPIPGISESIEECAVEQKQQQNENNLVSRIANILNDRGDQQSFRTQPVSSSSFDNDAVPILQNKPQNASNDAPEGSASDESIYSAVDLRLAALDLLTHLCSTDHGGKLLAGHRFATGRIIRLLHESIVAMYSYCPKTHERTTACVNHGVMLLAHLCFVHSETLDLRSKLAAEPGGHHKHLVALSRVAFSSGESVIEEGIWSESAEAAHRMLDEFLSPEEGDAVVSVFSSLRSTSP